MTFATLATLTTLIAQAPAPRAIDMPEVFRPSPDGTAIAYEESGDLLVRPMAGGRARRVVTHTATEFVRSFVWSRNSRQLAFAICTRAKDAVGPPATPIRCEARVINRDGSGSRVLVAFEHGMWDENCLGRQGCRPMVNLLDWTPNGREIVALLRNRPADRMNQLGAISIADGNVRVLKSAPRVELIAFEWQPGVNYSGAVVSPDSRFLIHSADSIFALSLESGSEQMLFDHSEEEHDRMLGWSAGDRALVFARTVGQTTDVWKVAVTNGHADGAPVLLARDTGRMGAFGLTVTGSLYYRRAQGETRDVYTVPLDASSGRVSAPMRLVTVSHFGANTRPMWSPDGKLLAYRSGLTFATSDAIAVVDSGGDIVQRVSIGRPAEMALWEFDWAPDQRAFLFSQRAPLNPTTRSKALQVDRETGRTTAFGPNNDRNQFLRWLPDMKSIVFLSAANGVVMRDVTSGAERTLFQKADRGPLDSFSVSPDGRRIAIDVRDRETRGGSLTVIDVAEGGAKEIAALPSWNRLVNSADLAPVRHTFSGDGRHVLFLTNPDGKPDVELWRVAIDGGERQRLGVLTTDPNEHIHRLSARRTGDALAFELIRIEPPATFVLGASTALSAITAKRAVIPKPAVTPKPGRPPAPTAEAILAPAFERAKKESKNVLIDFSAKTWCVPCFQLRYFLTAPETSRILNHHFVVVELVVWENRDNIVLNNVGAEALMQQWDFSGGIPFVVFADPARRVLATSVSGTSFGGYPASAQQIDAFAALLPTVAPRMTEAERAVLVKWLREASVRLDFERPGSARRKW